MAGSSDLGLAVLESGSGPQPQLTVTPQIQAARVDWLMPGAKTEKYKLRDRAVGTRTFSKMVTTECKAGETCEYTLKEMSAEPYEVTVKDWEGKIREGKDVEFDRHILVTPLPPAGAPVNTAAPAITGEPAVSTGAIRLGQTLTASTGTWENSPTSYSYEWLRCEGLGEGGSEEELGGECEPITIEEGAGKGSKATGSSYVVQAHDVSQTIVVRVEAKNAKGASAAVSNAELVLGSGEETPPPVPVSTAAPTITGVAQEGHLLTAHHGSWEGEPVLEDKWLHCKGRTSEGTGGSCSAIKVENHTTHEMEPYVGETYTPTSEDVGLYIEVQEKGHNPAGYNTAYSLAVEVTPNGPPVDLTPPSIEGAARKGITLHVVAGTWTNAPEKPAYQWLRCTGASCSAIEKATKSTYKLVTADLGHTIKVEETVQNSMGKSSPATSAASEEVIEPTGEPVNVTPPTMTGTFKQGETLTEHHGTWTNSPTGYSYQWKRCEAGGGGCVRISGAVSQTYQLVAADVGHSIVVRETASNAEGSNLANSATSEAVKGAVPVATAAPTVSGLAQEGQTLSAHHGTWTNEPTGYSYQWLYCNSLGVSCLPISGATGQTYSPAAAYVGDTLRVAETASNATGSGAASESNATLEVVPAAPVSTAPPSITGVAEHGQTLTEHHGTWTHEPTSYSYQWLRCEGASCGAIEGATTQSYVLTSADIGHTIKVKETAKNAGGWNVATSEATASVT